MSENFSLYWELGIKVKYVCIGGEFLQIWSRVTTYMCIFISIALMDS